MVAVHAALFTLPLLEMTASGPKAPGPRPRRGWIAALAAAALLRRWAVSSLGGAWNVRGAVAPGLVPVTRGPYRWVRHPNYLAVIVEFAALPMAAGAWRSAALLSAANAALLAGRIRAEEALLRSVPGYEAAFRGRARFLPGIF